jgi:deoxyguanosine kinase
MGEAMKREAANERRKRPRYIAVEGPIGAGKSSLAEILAAELGARLICENPAENPFLASFYKEPRRFALSTQLFFLLQRYGQQSDLLQGGLFEQGGIVSDYLFAKDRLFATLTLSPEELALYDRVYQALRPRVATPDLIVYLQAPTEVLLARIDKRGRPEEKPIRPDYVREVARAYAEYFFNYGDGPLLIVDASELDFVGNAEDRAALLEVINRTHGGINHWSRR